METSTFTVVLAAVVGAFGAAVGATVTALTAWGAWRKLSHGIQQESDASALVHFTSVIESLEGEVGRLTIQAERQVEQFRRQDRQIDEMAAGLREARDQHADCWSMLDGLYRWVEVYYRSACDYARKARRDPGEVIPAPPPRPVRPASPDHRWRSLEQNAEIVREIAKPKETPP